MSRHFAIVKRVNGRIVYSHGVVHNNVYTLYRNCRYIKFMAGKNVPARLKSMGYSLIIS
jgi:hypothetical protein